MPESAWVTAITTALTAVAMVLAKIAFPPRVDEDGPTLKELEPRYKARAIAGVPVLVGSIAACGFAWYYALTNATGRTVVRLPIEVWIRPDAAIFGLSAMLLGFSCGALITALFYWVMLGERFDEFCRYDQLASGYNTIRLIGLMCSGFAAVGIMIALAGSDWENGFTQKSIVINRGLSFGPETYSYLDIVSVRSSD